MKWRHNVNHITIAGKNFFYEIHDNLFVANIFRFDIVFAVRVLYQSGCYIKVAKNCHREQVYLNLIAK